MFRNYIKLALRNLVKNRVHSFISIGGLAVGMAVSLLIGLWIWNELSFDRAFGNYKNIAQVMQNQDFEGDIRTWTGQARQLAPELRSTYGNLFKYVVLSTFIEQHTLSVEDKKLAKTGSYMEPDAASMLTLSMIKGSRTGLQEPGSILLSESVAKAFFGTGNAMNKLMKIDNKLDVKVTGVYKDLPQNSSFSDLGYIAPWELMAKSAELEKREIGWGNSWFQVFAQISDNSNMNEVSAKIRNAKLNRIGADDAGFKPVIFLHPMSKWHLYSEFRNGVVAGGGINNVWMFGTIGLFVLLLACINFMNLSTARSEKRAKEVGIRKAIGSMRFQLISQFFSESLLVAALGFILSLLLVQLILPWFNGVTAQTISIPWTSPVFWLIGTGFGFLTGLVAGAYPALYLSSFKPVKVLKGVFRAGSMAAVPRKVLVVLQFTASVTLIICTAVVLLQIRFARSRDIGYNKTQLVTVPIKSEELKKHFTALRNDLINTGAVKEITQAQGTATTAFVSNSGLTWRGKVPGMQDEFVTIATDHQFGKTLNWQISRGRDFSPAFATDTMGFILNETAVRYMGFKDPIGEPIKAFDGNYHVIGVVKDLVMQSPYDPVRPMIFYIDKYNRTSSCIVNMNPLMNAARAMEKIESVFKKYDPASPFDYVFADTEYNSKFRKEELVGKLAGLFTILAIFISGLGLFGMASFMAEQRVKEIGVRKVLGASVFNLWRLLSKDFVVLIIISILIASPLAWYFMNDWLQHYQYRTNISWWIFAATGLGAMLITLLTVSYQSIKAAMENPVKSLRSE